MYSRKKFNTDWLEYDFFTSIDFSNKNIKIMFISIDIFFLKLIRFFKKIHVRSIIFEKNCKITKIFLNLLNRNGAKIKYKILLTKVLLNIHENFFNFNENLNQMHTMYWTYYNTSKTNNLFFNLKNILLFLIEYLTSVFFFKIIKKKKKKKKKVKKSKKKYEYKIIFLIERKRIKIVLKQLILYSCTFKFFKFSTRLYYSFLKTLLDWKKGYLFKQKKKLYTTIASNYKNIIV